MDLVASTGQNDRSSIWGQEFLWTVEGLTNAAANLVRALRPGENTATGSAQPTARETGLAQQTAGQSAQPAWLWPAVIGAAVLVALLLLVRK